MVVSGSSIQGPGPAVYIHIPFCASKCLYCDFASYAGINGLMEPYTNALIREIETTHAKHGCGSIYMGGGTPSMLSPEVTTNIMSAVFKRFNPAATAEISIEVNPDSATQDGLERYLKAGFNRLSMGVQSFNDAMLKNLGRAHDSQKAKDAFSMARKAGFRNISIDLIYGIPGQTVADFEKDIEQAISLVPDHISAYQLTVEEETPLWDLVEEGKVKLPDDDVMLTMYDKAISKLAAAGYVHYEVSNFAKPGMECRHNLAYWLGEEFIGFGNGAHSFVDSCRYANPDEPDDYIYEIDTAGEAGLEILADEKDKVLDFLLMRLRLVGKKSSFEELDEKIFTHGNHGNSSFKVAYSKALENIVLNHLAVVENDGFCLTFKGMLFLDDVLLEFEKI